ncbi:MAG: GntR family transcriptional regulator [Chloroflexota bacterium]
MAEGGTLARSVLADEVKDRLLQDILSGRYPPHSRIVETAVARELGISQAPVREALRGLEATGVVEILPFRGARVRRPTTEELLEAITIRAELEAIGARLAVPRLTDAQLDELLAQGQELRRAAQTGDPHALAIADAKFHGLIIQHSGNATLVRLWRSLEPFSRTYITAAIPGVDVHWTAALHWPILEALRNRDPGGVVHALRQHFDRAGSKIDAGWSDEEPDSGAEAEQQTPIES